ncbi:MAG: hypothetical protein KF805_12580 [Phycisphaeraceae bacterium]|nr:hypothetical protein [Phycisphaeraceae bacterium]
MKRLRRRTLLDLVSFLCILIIVLAAATGYGATKCEGPQEMPAKKHTPASEG